MDKQFDELSKSLAEDGVSRREALRKIGFSLAGVLLASLGLGKKARAGGGCKTNADCPAGDYCHNGSCVRCACVNYGVCYPAGTPSYCCLPYLGCGSPWNQHCLQMHMRVCLPA
jgi:hypothetical protein